MIEVFYATAHYTCNASKVILFKYNINIKFVNIQAVK
jgi:hypothetical protein